MNNTVKRLILIALSVLIVISCTATVFAETIYYYYGYHYTYINNDKVSLYGIDEDMTELSVPDIINDRALVDIRNNAFMDDADLKTLDFSGAYNLERIGSFAFKGCTELTGMINLPENLSVLGTAAFQESAIKSIAFNITASHIPNQCCYKCSELSAVSLGGTIKTIGDYAFANCPKLTYIELPRSVESISDVAFYKDNITLGVYTDSAAHQFAVNNDIPFILLDAPVVPTEPPTEAPTEAPTEPVIPTEEPTIAPTEQPTETSGYYLGDVNGDNAVDVIDSTLIQRYLASVTYPETCVMMHGDVDGDGVVTILDATYISRYNARIDVRYPIGEWQAE